MEKPFTYPLKTCHNQFVLRITSGIFRGRYIQSLPGLETRPTVERLRQAWLNSIQMGLTDARILDLFSGSGAMGLEAISRGASFVTFVESNPKAAALIQQNINALGVQDQAKVINKKVENALNELIQEPPCDFIFMDPPYHQGFEEMILSQWPITEMLTEQGKLCIESAKRKGSKTIGGYPPPANLKITRDERYGDSQLTFYSPERSDQA
jgi:16S rRNA (guanine966-N2)-methyltransferase